MAEQKQLPGRKLGDRRVVVDRPHARYFRYVAPGRLEAKLEAQAPRTEWGRRRAVLSSVLFGRPLPSEADLTERLPKWKALPVFSSDVMSSVAYASEASLFTLAAVGASAFGYLTKRDLTGWGSFLFMGLIGVVIASLVNIFTRSSAVSWIISAVGVIVFTGLTALSWSVESLIALRFLTGMAMGSEWSTGATLIAETWPDRARPKGAGFMQSGFGFGTFLASLVWYFVHPLGPQAWRWLFVFGVMPAF